METLVASSWPSIRGAVAAIRAELGFVDVSTDCDRHGAVIPDVSGQPPGVDFRESNQAVAMEQRGKRSFGPPVRVSARQASDHHPGSRRLERLVVVVVDPVVADVRRGHHHHLAGIGRIGEHLLIAGHGGVEDELPGGNPIDAHRDPSEDGAVGCYEEALHALLGRGL